MAPGTDWKKMIEERQKQRAQKAQAEKRKYEEKLENSPKVQKMEPVVKKDESEFEQKFHSEDLKTEANGSSMVIKWDESDENVQIPVIEEPVKKKVILKKMFGNKNVKTIPPPPPTQCPDLPPPTPCPAPPLAILDAPIDTSCSKVETSLQKDVNWNELIIKKEVIRQNEESVRAEVRKSKNRNFRDVVSTTQKQKIIERQKETIRQAENIMTMKCDPGYVPPPPPPSDGNAELEPVSSADSLPDLVPIDEPEKDPVVDPNDKVVEGLLDQVTVITKTEFPSGSFSRAHYLHSTLVQF